jgi:endonuclease YncB( thermonuclease family)
MLVRPLLLICLLASCSPSTRAQPDNSEALNRLRERLDESATPTATPENQPTEVVDGAPPASSRLLQPRYGGALPDDDPRVLGVFRFRERPDPIIDGDTVAVIGLDASLRLLGIDAEETFFRNDELRGRAYSDFPGYLEIIYADATGIPKFATPMGEEAKAFAHDFFAGDTEVRLEYDDLRRTRGYYDRYLVYVFALRGGDWINYNIEAVRAGMTPYFTKYGYSLRFHDEFIEAQEEAQAAERGIWDPELRHYPDYEERMVAWNRRGDTIAYYAEHHGDDPAYAELVVNEDWYRLDELDGQTVTVFGALGDIHLDWNPPRVNISHRRGNDFTLVGFRDGVFDQYNLEEHRGEYVYIRGVLNFYQGRPQFIVDNGIEVWTEP